MKNALPHYTDGSPSQRDGADTISLLRFHDPTRHERQRRNIIINPRNMGIAYSQSLILIYPSAAVYKGPASPATTHGFVPVAQRRCVLAREPPKIRHRQ